MRVNRSPDGRVFVALKTEFEFLSPVEATAVGEALIKAAKPVTATPAAAAKSARTAFGSSEA
jgi:hypothetical protein